MNILLLNASPKNDGATQEILNVIKNALPLSVLSELVCLGDMNISYCLGEKACYETASCIVNDDMGLLIEKIDRADILVIAAPSYWGGVPGQFKAFIDRCTVYGDTNPNPSHRVLKSGKKCCAIALRTGSRAFECEQIIETIAHWCGHMKIEMADGVYFCGINDKNDIAANAEALRESAEKWFGALLQPT